MRREKYKRKIGENGDVDIEMRPDPDAGEIPASEALGKPVEEEPSIHQRAQGSTPQKRSRS